MTGYSSSDTAEKETSPAHDDDEESIPLPLLCLDVNLGHGLSPQIVIYEGQDPEKVAEKFVQEYGMKTVINNCRYWRGQEKPFDCGDKRVA